MSLVEGIPSHIVSNMASIQANINSILANAAQNVRNAQTSNLSFSNFLDDSKLNFKSFDNNVKYMDSAYENINNKTAPQINNPRFTRGLYSRSGLNAIISWLKGHLHLPSMFHQINAHTVVSSEVSCGQSASATYTVTLYLMTQGSLQMCVEARGTGNCEGCEHTF